MLRCNFGRAGRAGRGRAGAVLIVAFIWLVGSNWWVGAEEASAPLKVLCVGNSFSRNAVRFLPQIAAAGGEQIKVYNLYIGGCDFERHVRHAREFAAYPDAEAGRPYRGFKEGDAKSSLQQALISDKWDIVTIQQVSSKSFKPETFKPHADELMKIIRELAPHAEIVVHQTWAYREDHNFWGRTDFNTGVMYAALRLTYDNFAKEAGLRQIPSGDAMESARQSNKWGPYLEGEPLQPRPERSLYKDDKYHANNKGEYLQACVWFEFLFKKSVVGNSFVPQDVSQAECDVLQQIAHRVVSHGERPVIAE